MRHFLVLCLLAACGNAHAQSGPGGVGSSTNNVLWLDANYGISHLLGAVNTWNDRSGNGNHAYLPVTIPLGTPQIVSNSVNGYPSLDFDGVDDQLWVVDHATLDLTQWHFFMVVTADLQKNYNAWMVKGDDALENYEMLSYSDGNIHTPIYWTDATRTHPSSAGGQVTTTTFDIIEYSYSAAVGRDVYKNGTTIITDNENKTPQVNNRPLYIGNERSTLGREVNGDIAEVIAYNAPLNGTQRIVLNNYLAAKYNRTLSTGDLYLQDNAGQGNYDHDVAGIGRISSTDLQSDARGTGILRINNPTGLGDNEFLLWGRNSGALGTFGVTDLPPGVQGRWARTWRANEVNASGTAVDVGAVDLTWDLASFASVTASHLRLLVDTDNDGVFADETPITGATSLGGGLYHFAGVTAISNDRQFTLGTSNIGATPLPVELIEFDATATGPASALLEWRTASERDNDRFTVERSSQADVWESVAVVDAIGNSTTLTRYTAEDNSAPGGLCYYRLRQTDMDGASHLSQTVAVQFLSTGNEVLVHPNPVRGPFNIRFEHVREHPVAVRLMDASGRVVAVRYMGTDRTGVFDPGQLAPGIYSLQIDGMAGGSMQRVQLLD
ncbi:MAG TPA: hypothetical protein PLB89_11330 [Flavobacteriales bacterium]|nr:hypothetical protein [Flavobacteriales bacterium]